MVMYKIDWRGGGSKNRSLGQTHLLSVDNMVQVISKVLVIS